MKKIKIKLITKDSAQLPVNDETLLEFFEKTIGKPVIKNEEDEKVEDDRNITTLKSIKKVLIHMEKAFITKKPILLLSRSGWGKTQLVEQFAASKGYSEKDGTLIEITLSGWLPEDFRGLPVLKQSALKGKKQTEFAVPDFVVQIASNPNKKYMIFLDEINRASHEVQTIIFNMAQKSKIGDIQVDNIYLIAAANEKSEDPYVNELSTPLMNRFAVIRMEENPEDAKAYLTKKFKNKINSEILDFVMSLPIRTDPRSLEGALDDIDDAEERQTTDGIELIAIAGFDDGEIAKIEHMLKKTFKKGKMESLEEKLKAAQAEYSEEKNKLVGKGRVVPELNRQNINWESMDNTLDEELENKLLNLKQKILKKYNLNEDEVASIMEF